MPALELLFLSIFSGYMLGSLPFAYLAGRRVRVDVFSTGTGLAGAANVYRNVGHRSAVAVGIGDLAKGMSVVIVADRLGVEGAWLLVSAATAILGHWHSMFTRLRGGDGLLTLVGITLLAVPIYSLIAIGFGIAVGFRFRRQGHPTLYGGIACYGLLLALALLHRADNVVTSGIVTLALVVLAHAVLSHAHRNQLPENRLTL